MLHILKSLQQIAQVAAMFSANDEILLTEEAVYAANSHHPVFPIIKSMKCSVLKNDAQARAMMNRVSPSLTVVDYEQFVQLTAYYDKSLTWE
ncbi:sulfurtransferase complex subunit TusB [Vibrio sinensis]|uniref:Sulfurtransferase complex subunit TusB n=1 Tax=Vibrio sinensis TaxID=2302434 RepID=A0A3A6QTT2_9VIBR|nr:sulfurtransferase complex subunit TusB [Vibrio sinensis]RJX65012.1 sulfurtransferase complex subunit TusB [Vibrio sinensis]